MGKPNPVSAVRYRKFGDSQVPNPAYPKQQPLAAVPRIPRDDLSSGYRDAMVSIAFDFDRTEEVLAGKQGSDPDADFFDMTSAVRHISFPLFTDVPDEIKVDAFMLPRSRAIGPTDQAAPYPPNRALSDRIVPNDDWTPNTLWGGGYIQALGTRQGTYPTIEPTLRPPLEMPRYDYGAVDSDTLYAEAQKRVQAGIDAVYGRLKS